MYLSRFLLYVENGVLVGRFALQPLYGSIPIYDEAM